MIVRLLPALGVMVALEAVPLCADVKLPAIFGDHMVLQQEMKLPVWGTAAPGEAITVTVGTETAQTKADASGNWRADLLPLSATSQPTTLTVTGKNTVTFTDVLIGDVWLCSGQSNMGYTLGGGSNTFGGVVNTPEVVAQAADPQMRLFRVKGNDSIEPLSDVEGAWELCTPETASAFSGVGYFFGKALREHLQRPIGLIDNAVGGTPAQAWTSLSGLEKEPLLKPYVDTYNQTHSQYAQAAADYPQKKAAYQATLTQWLHGPGKPYLEALKAWNQKHHAATLAGAAIEAKPRPPPGTPQPPEAPDGGPKAPTVLYNALVAPLIPLAIKGVAWYQGENNQGEGKDYRTIFGNMIRDWREKWGEGDFPFVYVQLANYKAGPIQSWPYVRESQLKTLALPNTGMAVAVDVGNPGNVHPADKLDVGNRLALAARHVAYGEDIVYSGPIYSSMKVSGNQIALSFTHQGGGLIIGQAPWVPTGFQPLPNDHLVGFTIAGADKNFVPADARIDGDKVIVSSPQVAAPAAVRYDWANAPECNLYNKEKLPASPFRTDDWSDPLAEGHIALPGEALSPMQKAALQHYH